MVNDQCVGDDKIEHAFGPGGAGHLSHTVAQRLAAAELRLVAVVGKILLHFDDQLSVGQAHPVPHSGAVEIGVGSSWNAKGHSEILLERN